MVLGLGLGGVESAAVAPADAHSPGVAPIPTPDQVLPPFGGGVYVQRELQVVVVVVFISVAVGGWREDHRISGADDPVHVLDLAWGHGGRLARQGLEDAERRPPAPVAAPGGTRPAVVLLASAETVVVAVAGLGGRGRRDDDGVGVGGGSPDRRLGRCRERQSEGGSMGEDGEHRNRRERGGREPPRPSRAPTHPDRHCCRWSSIPAGINNDVGTARGRDRRIILPPAPVMPPG